MGDAKKKTAALHSLGCKVNAYETEAMRQQLQAAGYEIVEFTQKADVYVINTCSVTNIADRKSRQMIHRAKKHNPDSIVVAAGCYVQTKQQEARSDLSVDLMIGNNKKQDLVSALRAYEADKSRRELFTEISHRQPFESLSLHSATQHTRAFVKVQDGCNQFCSYCIIPYARGRIRSRRMSDALEEIGRLAADGCKEIVLSGIHLSSYGADTGESLSDLIKRAAKTAGIRRIRLGSLEPMVVTEEFVRELSQIDEICPHFHLSLQSGCNETLRRMNRRYTVEEYRAACGLLRRYFEHPAITTDVIAGFPGETDEEFEQTRRFLEEIHFYEMHIFKYSGRAGTKAALMPDQIPEEVKAKRSEILIALADAMSEEYRAYYAGKETEVLLEEPLAIDGTSYYAGYTKEYVKAAVRTEKNLSNMLKKGRIAGRLAQGIYVLVEF